MELLHRSRLESLEDVDPPLGVSEVEARNIVQCLACLFLTGEQVGADLPPALQAEGLLVALVEYFLERPHHPALPVRHDVDYSLEDVLGPLLLLLPPHHRHDLLHFLPLLLWVLDHCLLLGGRLDECSDRVGERESNNQDSIAVEVVAGSDYLLHLIPSSGIEVDIFGLEVLEGVAGDDWDLIPCVGHGGLEELEEGACGDSVVVAEYFFGGREEGLSQLGLLLLRLLLRLLLDLLLLFLLSLSLLLGVFFHRLLLLHLFLDSLADIEHLHIGLHFLAIHLVPVMQFEFEVVRAHLLLEVGRVHQAR